MNNAGSTLIEYALVAALVSIVVLAAAGDLRFPGAAVVALSEVASGPQEAEFPGSTSEFQAYSPGGRSFAGTASGPGFPRGAGASGSAKVVWTGSPAAAAARVRHPEPPDATLFDVDAAMIATFAEPDGPTAGASSAGSDEETASPRGRQIEDRSTGNKETARIRQVSPKSPARRPDPAAEQLVSLGPGNKAEALTVARASFGKIAETARGETAREIRSRSTSGFSRDQPARPAEAHTTAVTGTFRIGNRRIWALVVLMLASLGFGAHRLARRLRSMERRVRNPCTRLVVSRSATRVAKNGLPAFRNPVMDRGFSFPLRSGSLSTGPRLAAGSFFRPCRGADARFLSIQY